MSLSRFPSRRGDRGMTLPELLVTFTMMGLLATVLASAISITLRQSQDSEGRLNVANAEQSIDTWLPADLASTDVTNTDLPAVELDADATPCGDCTGIDLGGANALQLAWTTTEPGDSPSDPPREVTTKVQYQYIERGGVWEMDRIECIDGRRCTSRVLLTDLMPPADPDAFDPTTDRPVWVMDVAAPDMSQGLELSENAQQVVVTVNGGGRTDGAGGGLNSISLTAGGRVTSELAADEFTVPSFVRAKSRCGGNITLIVDESNSVSDTQMTDVVEPGVRAFIEAFRGTPTQVQLVTFGSNAESIHPAPDGNADQDTGGQWHNYIDMTNDTLVNQLRDRVAPRLGAPGDINGGTNWEDAFFRVFREENGDAARELPRRLVFFTDGVPTFHRRSNLDSKNQPVASTIVSNGTIRDFSDAGKYDGSIWTMAKGNKFYQEAWDRADVILDQHRDIDLIFVGVGDGLDDTIEWRHNPAAYTNPSAPLGAAPDPAMTGSDALTYLLANAPTGEVVAQWDADTGTYTNPETANYYDQADFDEDQFAAAMKAAALKDCGGTLTLQTRTTDGASVLDEFVYENTEYRDQDGTVITATPRTVTTSSVFSTGTFDFELDGADSFFVDIVPQNLASLNGYNPYGDDGGWRCRAGSDEKRIEPIVVDGRFDGFTVELAANEAVSCILTVSN